MLTVTEAAMCSFANASDPRGGEVMLSAVFCAQPTNTSSSAPLAMWAW